MVRPGPISKLAEVERAIMETLLRSHARAAGMGFREIYRNLQDRPQTSKAGSFSTLSKCLRNLERNRIVRRSTVTKKYSVDEIVLAHYDRDLVMEAILRSNAFGGGRLFQPDFDILSDGVCLPEKKPEVFAVVDAFIQANIKGKWRWPDEGVQFIETFEGAWPEKQSEAHENAEEASKIAARERREPFHCVSLVMKRLNANRIARDWVKAVWDYAQKSGLVNRDLSLDKASNEQLERIWKEIFTDTKVETIVFTEFIKPTKLLEWWVASRC